MFDGWYLVFNATFNNISVISLLSVLLVEETGVPEKTADLSRALTNYHSLLYRHEQGSTHNFSGDRH
jgi:hypothetical protein